MNDTPPRPVALTIAGSDSGGGAGIQADLKAMQANRVFAASVITAITAQNTVAVTAVHELPVALVRAQLDAVASDLPVVAVKTGMLGSPALIEGVAEGLAAYELGPVVVDPVMISKSGYPLLPDEAIDALVELLLPHATVVTPNVHEASRLAGLSIKSTDDARRAAEAIHGMGAAAVLVKGGHLADPDVCTDVLFDGTQFATFAAPRHDTPHTHGTGCTYAAAIAAQLARGRPLVEAIRRAKAYVTQAIRHGLAIGKGHGPTDHFYMLDALPEE